MLSLDALVWTQAKIFKMAKSQDQPIQLYSKSIANFSSAANAQYFQFLMTTMQNRTW